MDRWSFKILRVFYITYKLINSGPFNTRHIKEIHTHCRSILLFFVTIMLSNKTRNPVEYTSAGFLLYRKWESNPHSKGTRV